MLLISYSLNLCTSDVQHMGYGSRAMELIIAYFQGQGGVGGSVVSSGSLEVGDLGSEGNAEGDADENAEGLASERLQPRVKLPPLLTPIHKHKAERLHWIGVSFGLTAQLLNFWSRRQLKVCYIRQSRNDLTGEHSAIMIRELDCTGMQEASIPAVGWLDAFVSDYRRRMVSLLSYSFRDIESAVALTLVDPERKITGINDEVGKMPTTSLGVKSSATDPSASNSLVSEEIYAHYMSPHDIKRLEMYANNLVDHHVVLDLLPTLARLLFLGRLPSTHLSALQAVIMIAIGLQHRDADSVATELKLPVSQVLAFFNKTIRKLTSSIRGLLERDVAAELKLDRRTDTSKVEAAVAGMISLPSSLSKEHADDEKSFRAQSQQQLLKLQSADKEHLLSSIELSSHTVIASDEVLANALNQGLKKQRTVPPVISVPVGVTSHAEKRHVEEESAATEDATQARKKKKKKHVGKEMK